jgi:hypothetical protein
MWCYVMYVSTGKNLLPVHIIYSTKTLFWVVFNVVAYGVASRSVKQRPIQRLALVHSRNVV